MTTKKVPAHDRWVCLDCRWSAKIPLIDARAANRPTYDCPKCKKHMLWTGTAFRPPRRGDDEGWLIAERILRAGHRFRATRRRERFPRKLGELGSWLRSRERGRVWLAEKALSVEKVPGGDLKVRLGRRTLADGEQILILHRRVWDVGRLKLRGDGRRPLPSPLVTLSSTGRSVPLTSQTRTRVASL
jgi:hypothetical protein